MANVKNQECCAPEGLKTSGDLDEDLSSLCKALSHSARIRLIRLLADKGTCISGDLAGAMDLAQSTVSEHLRILKEAGVIKGTLDGPKRCYCLNRDVLTFVQKLLAQI